MHAKRNKQKRPVGAYLASELVKQASTLITERKIDMTAFLEEILAARLIDERLLTKADIIRLAQSGLIKSNTLLAILQRPDQPEVQNLQHQPCATAQVPENQRTKS